MNWDGVITICFIVAAVLQARENYNLKKRMAWYDRKFGDVRGCLAIMREERGKNPHLEKLWLTFNKDIEI